MMSQVMVEFLHAKLLTVDVQAMWSQQFT